VAFFTAVLGSAPVHQDGAWVWTDVRRAPPPIPVGRATLTSCLAAAGTADAAPMDPSAACVLSGTTGG
jgi:hypothetical protein